MFLDMVCKAPPLISCNDLPKGTVLDDHLVFTICRSIPVFGVLIHVHTDDSLAL